jgi:hypothetical protein
MNIVVAYDHSGLLRLWVSLCELATFQFSSGRFSEEHLSGNEWGSAVISDLAVK